MDKARKARRAIPCLPGAGESHTHQSSFSDTFFSNITAKAWAPILPMLFPTRLDIIMEQKRIRAREGLQK
jgi:hypothetical protein